MKVIKKLFLSLLICVVTISSVCILDKQEVVVQKIDADSYCNINLTPDQIENIFNKLGEGDSISPTDVIGGVFKVAGVVAQVLTALGVLEDPEQLKYQNLLNKLDAIYYAVKDVNDNINRLTENINTQLAKVIGSTERVSTQLYVQGINNFENNYEEPLEASINTVRTEVMNRVHNWYENRNNAFNQYLYEDKFRVNATYTDYANNATGVEKEVEIEIDGEILNAYRRQRERVYRWRDASKVEEYIKPIFENIFDGYINSRISNDDFYNWLKVVDVSETNPFVGFDPITQRKDMITRYNELSGEQKTELRDKFAAAGYESLRKEALNIYSRSEGYMSTLLSIFKAYCDRLSESNSISGEFKNSPLRDHYNIYKTIYGFQGDLNFTGLAKVYDENGKETGEKKEVKSNLAEAARLKYITNLVKFGTYVTIMAKESRDVSHEDLYELIFEPWAAAENRINQIYNEFYKIIDGTPMDDWCYITDCVLRYDTATVSSHSELLHKNCTDQSYYQDSFKYYEKYQKYDDWNCSVSNTEILDSVGVKRLYARAQALYGGNVNLTSYLNKNLWYDNRIPTPNSTVTNDSGYQATYIMTHYDGSKDFNLNDHVEMRVHKIGHGDWFGIYDGPCQAFGTNTDPNNNITETYYKKHDAAYGQFTSLIDTTIDSDVSIARRAVFARDGFLWNRSEMAFMWDAIVDSKHIFSDKTYDETWIFHGKQYYDKTKSCSEYCSSSMTHYDPDSSGSRYYDYEEFITEYMDISRKVGILRLDKNIKPSSTPSPNDMTLDSTYPIEEKNDDFSSYDNRTNKYGQTVLLASEESLPQLVSELSIKNIAMDKLDGKKIKNISIKKVEEIYNKYLKELYNDYSYDEELDYLPYVVYLDDAYKEAGFTLKDAIEYLFEKDEGAALYRNLIDMSLDYNKLIEDLKAVSYKPINIEENTLKSLIAEANKYNNNPENLVSAVFDTIEQRNKETMKGIQDGVTCYVSSNDKYYIYKRGRWSSMKAPTVNISDDAILEYETNCFVGFEISINKNGDIVYENQPVYDINYHLKDSNGIVYDISASLLQKVGIDRVNIHIPVFDANEGDDRAVVEIYENKNYFVDPILTTGIINDEDNMKYLELNVDSTGYPLYVSNTYKYSSQRYKIPNTGVQ